MPTESFFNFFTPPQPPKEDDDEEEIDDVGSDIEDRLELDYQLGEDIKEKLIPRAIDWFTGEALAYEELDDEDLGSNDFDDDEDEDDLSDDHDDDEEETDEEVCLCPSPRALERYVAHNFLGWLRQAETRGRRVQAELEVIAYDIRGVEYGRVEACGVETAGGRIFFGGQSCCVPTYVRTT